MSASMSRSRLAEKYGVTPGKLVLIGLLAVVFLSVVYWNFLRDASGGEPETAVEEADPPASAQPQTAGQKGSPARPAENPPTEDVPPKPWPRFQLDEVIARDPFALPEQFPQPAPSQVAVAVEAAPDGSQPGDAADEARAAELAAIQQQGVQLILRNGQECIAMIGDRQVRVGDTIGGFRVVDISLRDGVILEGDTSP